MEKKSDNSGCWGVFSIIPILIFVGIGYWIYIEWYYDYPSHIETAIEESNFQRANKLLNEMKRDNRYKKNWLSDAQYPVYVETFNKVLQAEISYLVNEGDQQGSDRLIALINEYPIESNPTVGTTHDSSIIEGNDLYNSEVGKYNGYCHQVLSRAISSGNQYLAEAIINSFKPTLNRTKVDTHLLGSDEYDYQYIETEKDRAKELLKEAIKEGKFKKDL